MDHLGGESPDDAARPFRCGEAALIAAGGRIMKAHLLPLLALALTGACATWVVTDPFAPTPAAALPETPADRRESALFYSDMGPETVDVSTYPDEHKRGYAVYANVCSRCHTLARSINSPYVGRGWWEFYITSMRVRAKFHDDPLSAKDVRTILDFLEYDSNRRKVVYAVEFEKTKIELKRRFDLALDERLEKLQKNPLPDRRR